MNGGRLLRKVLCAAVLWPLVAGCADATQGGASGVPATQHVPEVVAVYPHASDAFTQGLVYHDGFLFESTGLYGRSSLRKVELHTGQVVRMRLLEETYFGEGLALIGDRLIQLTWREQVAFVYDATTFERLGKFAYDGEGWGLCYDGESLWMSNGSSLLTRRDPDTFEALGQVQVLLQGVPLPNLNELACAQGYVYANVFPIDLIVKIEVESGNVLSRIDGSSLLPPEQRRQLPRNAVLNGIAYDSEREVFFLTGKLWPKLFEVRFLEAP